MQIHFNEAILVAVIGLIVNAVCIVVMNKEHAGHALHEHHDETEDKPEDYNYKAAYYHILADALTSVLAIIALVTGKYFNIVCLDPLIGIAGGCLIIKWAAGLLKKTISILIDMKCTL